MAKPKRALSRARKTKRAPAPKPSDPSPSKPPLARRHRYTPELLASGRRRYEHSEESIPSIALDFGIDKTTLQRMAKREGWVRYVPPPRDLPAAARLLAQTQALELATQPEDRHPHADADSPAVGVPPDQDSGDAGDANLPPLAGTLGRLYCAVLEELAAVESMRAELKRRPQSPLDAERTARTLSSLTETLQKLQRMQCAVPSNGPDDDDMPADIDEFRHALARRIEAFVASRTEPGDASGAATQPMGAV